MSAIYNQSRMTGLFSSMDTDAMVKAMVGNQQLKIDKLNQSKTKAEWKKDTITDFNNQIRQFREKFGSSLSKTNLITKSGFAEFAVKMAETDAFTVRGTSVSSVGSYSLRIQQLATAASVNSGKLTNRQAGLTSADLSTAVNSLTGLRNGGFDGSDVEPIDFTINGVSFSFTQSDSLKTIMDTVNKSDAGVTMSYSQITDSINIVGKNTGAMTGVQDPGEEPQQPVFTMQRPDASQYGGDQDPQYVLKLKEYNDAQAKYNSDLDSYAKDMKAYKEAKANYEADQKRGLNITDTSGFLTDLGLSEIIGGQDAMVSINGGELLQFSTNQFSLDGLEFSLNRTTGSVTHDFSVTKNTTATLDKIKGFVEEFNSLIKTLFDAYSEKKDYKYNPLSASMKEGMTEKEIEDWEAQAKKGILYRDNRLGSLLNSTRGALSAVLGGEDTLASIGITVTPYKVGEAWALEIDEEKLTKALEENTDRVFNIFGAAEKVDPKGGGLVTRLNKFMDSYVSATKQNDLSNLVKSIDDYKKHIEEQEDKLYTMSERYYMQYAKMETAMSKMQSQTSQITNMLGVSGS